MCSQRVPAPKWRGCPARNQPGTPLSAGSHPSSDLALSGRAAARGGACACCDAGGCPADRLQPASTPHRTTTARTRFLFSDVEEFAHKGLTCLLYTSDAADDLLCVDLGG